MVVVTHPWIPKGRGLLEYINGDFTMAYPGERRSAEKAAVLYRHRLGRAAGAGQCGVRHGHLEKRSPAHTGPVTIDGCACGDQTIDGGRQRDLHVAVTLNNAGTETATRTVTLKLKPDNFAGAAQDLPPLTLTAAPGPTRAEADVTVAQAHLWWSWDTGPQNLYRLEAASSAAKAIGAINAR